MAQQTINNGETGLVVRGKINDNFTELYGTDFKVEWFEEIGAGTGGTLTKPTGSTIVLNEWANGVDALASTSAGTSDLPLYETPVTSGGVAITATLDVSGNWTLSGTPSAYPVCLIYVYTVPIESWDEAKSLVTTEFGGKQDDVITTRGDVIIGNASAAASRLAVGTVGQVLSTDGTDVSWGAAGTGDVTASAALTDDKLVMGDTASKAVQTTGIGVDANNGVIGAGTVVENVAGAFSAFDLTDAGRTFIATGTTATWTFPANASIAYPIGTVINGLNNGSGLLTIALTTDTLVSAGSLVDVSVDAAFSMIKTAATAWTLAGGLE